jgi:hypothetical protein
MRTSASVEDAVSFLTLLFTLESEKEGAKRTATGGYRVSAGG